MNKPTQGQIERLWEWCGFETINYLDTSGKVCGTHYVSPDKSWGKSWFPPIDLNNLWQYAIPVVKKKCGNWKSILHNWKAEVSADMRITSEAHGKNPALALFWAIYRAIEKELLPVEEKTTVLPKEEDLPTAKDLQGMVPDFTGDQTTEDYVRSLRE